MSRGRGNFRQGDMTKAFKAAVAAGVEISRVEIEPDGRIILVAGKTSGETVDPLDRELAEFEGRRGKN